MSQQPPPYETPWVPPPPPSSNSMYPPEVLAAKAAQAASDAKNALILSLLGIVCFGLILGIIAFKKANSAIETIDTYQVAQDKRGLAVAAKVIGIIDIVLWAIGIFARIAMR